MAEVTSPAEVTPPAAAAGTGCREGGSLCFGGMRMLGTGSGSWGGSCGFLPRHRVVLSTLFTPSPLPAAAAMNLDRIGEHAEAMFGVG